MPFNRPSIQTLIDRAAGDIESRLPGADARLRRSVTNVLAKMHAGAVHGLYGYLDWLALQLMPDTAEQEHLERWASIWGVSRRAAVAATGLADFTGTNASVIPAGTLLQRSDGVEYTTDAEATISGGVASVAITAAIPSVDGNADVGVSLTLVSPIAGVQSQVYVAAGGVTGGDDTETDDSFRNVLLRRIQQPPHGGAQHDYIQWAGESHASITRTWVYPQELVANGVTVRIMTDDATANGIPEQTVIDAAQAYIDTQRPVTADVVVVAPVAVALDLTISGLSPSTVTVKEAIEGEITDLIRRESEPGGTLLISHIREAISIASGEIDHVLTSPVADVTHATGEIAVMGTITWV